ncbi:MULTISPECIES: MATE family efflux transporter [Eubacteriales]|uniref:Probable multidrug resistance protein NorM n=1 Tax=Bittarella massiliensis (ex Durand et al. 2017) TaxID=1720313 RepID=A0AAQ1MDN5_9FIRM|nr:MULTISPECIES: MATE family efflux transporter [Eubacteriales]ERI97218.1 MATE efflux family protein [Clostridium sp. ATCC 29733]MZL70251.1 MATE family efflux transporter [Bittarella massiliensis (ex Durand et al. 2017)]MZL80983.1 MATE family efflux transporter [Bittarella massiliensis (ex Durand et al. 2017)]SHG15942.1 putative efflux protein, MATE family [Bittarella massiliensis (ex Durand et al. 2017)]
MALQNDLTRGGVRGHILRFALPLIVSNLFQALYNAVDMFFVGRYTGTAGLAAVSVSGPIMNIMIMTITGLSIGVSVMIASYAGRGEDGEVVQAAGTSIALYLLLAAAVTALGILFTPQILRLVQTPAEAFDQAVAYLRTIFAGIVFMFGYNLICAFQRGFDDSRSSMIFVLVATVTNIVLDFVFLRFFQLGAFGASLATVISQSVSFFMGVAYFRLNRHVITFHPKTIRISRPHLKRLLHLGLPTAAQQLLLNVAMTTFSGLANSFGLQASAAYGIGIKIDSFAMLPSDAINASMSSFSSQNLGAGKPERITEGLKESMKLALLIAAAVAAIVALFGSRIAGVFNSDPAVQELAGSYLRLSCLSYFGFATVHPLIGFLRGTGNSMVNFYNVFLSQYAVRIPVAFLCTRLMGFSGIAVAVIIGPIVSTLLYAWYIASGRWKRSAEAKEGLALAEKRRAQPGD